MPTNGFSIASLVLGHGHSPNSAFTVKGSHQFEEQHLKLPQPFSEQQHNTHMGMGVLPVHQDFVESRQLANKLNNNIDSRYKAAAPSLSLENKSDQEDEDIDDDDSMSIKVDEEDKDTFVSCTAFYNCYHH